MLAHELRNPLAPIRYAVAMAGKQGRSEAERLQAQGIIERQVGHMGRLLDDLLDVSRITRGTLALRRSAVDLDSIVAAAQESARPLIEARRHTLVVSLPEERIRLVVDPVRIAQVLANLLINAAKYTDSGGRIELEARRDGGELLVTVRDNGIGISAEMMPRVFTLFAQASPALERSEGGPRHRTRAGARPGGAARRYRQRAQRGRGPRQRRSRPGCRSGNPRGGRSR